MASCASPSRIDLSKDDDECLEVPIQGVDRMLQRMPQLTTGKVDGSGMRKKLIV